MLLVGDLAFQQELESGVLATVRGTAGKTFEKVPLRTRGQLHARIPVRNGRRSAGPGQPGRNPQGSASRRTTRLRSVNSGPG